MRKYGVDEFPDISANFFSWCGCGVVCLIDKGSYSEIHIAMKKGSRHLSRDMLKDAIIKAGKPLLALIDVKYKNVCNVAKKVGFKMVGKMRCRVAGQPKEVIEMRYQL